MIHWNGFLVLFRIKKTPGFLVLFRIKKDSRFDLFSKDYTTALVRGVGCDDF